MSDALLPCPECAARFEGVPLVCPHCDGDLAPVVMAARIRALEEETAADIAAGRWDPGAERWPWWPITTSLTMVLVGGVTWVLNLDSEFGGVRTMVFFLAAMIGLAGMLLFGHAVGFPGPWSLLRPYPAARAFVLAVSARRWHDAYRMLVPAARRVRRFRPEFDGYGEPRSAGDVDSVAAFAAWWEPLLQGSWKHSRRIQLMRLRTEQFDRDAALAVADLRLDRTDANSVVARSARGKMILRLHRYGRRWFVVDFVLSSEDE